MSDNSSSSAPALSLDNAYQIAFENFGVDGALVQLAGERDLNFKLSCGEESFVLKFAHPESDVSNLELQNRAISLSNAVTGFNSPRLIKSTQRQSIVSVAAPDGDIWHARCLTFVPGTPLGSIPVNDPRRNDKLWNDIGACVAALDSALEPLNQDRAARREFKWDLAAARDIVSSSEIVNGHSSDEEREKARILGWCLEEHTKIAERVESLGSSVIHNDPNDYNIMVPPGGDDDESEVDLLIRDSRIGIIDFGDVIYSKTIHNLAICLGYCVLDMPDPVDVAAKIVAGYSRERFLSETEISVLFPLLCMRLAQSVSIAHEQTRADPDNEYLAITERPAWDMLKRLSKLDSQIVAGQISAEVRKHSVTKGATGSAAVENEPDENDVHGQLESAAEISKLRAKHISPSLSIAYEKPLHIVRGRGQYLYDSSDMTYLDCVNNVCHVGHCHPEIVSAATEQIPLLNTNTRYLHENIVRLAQRLTSTMPDPLEVCFFVNSGSEANDLALRLARTFSNQTDVCVVDHGYHGHVSSLIEISPYKFNSEGGTGKPESTHVFPAPDLFRGEFKSGDPDCASMYAAQAKKILAAAESNGRQIAAFIAEPILSCGGQVVLPVGYLKEIYPEIRKRGGLCISDEVQVGFGRVGSHYWGFQLQNVVPDIVTMGKPFGNGHPLAAVVTTREIADRFNNGMEYFNTFGGNPVSCAIGLAVMNVIEKEGLQQHALDTGNWLLREFRELKTKHDQIGDVRGTGFFLGIEFVKDHDTLEPDASLAKSIVNQLRHKNILLSTDGPLRNVIKFKPPMVFSKADGERVVSELSKALRTTG